MFSLEDQIKDYTDENFSAEACAQRIFAASEKETDLSDRLEKMAIIQKSIETVLRTKVRNNYTLFLQANEQINQVDEEMADLKHLIENTQKLIDDARSHRLADSRAMRSNSLLPSLANKALLESLYRENSPSRVRAEMYNKIPLWLSKAPEELAQFIVEQQFGKAVMVVLKTRNYVESITSNLPGMARRMSKTRLDDDYDEIDDNLHGKVDQFQLDPLQLEAVEVLQNVNGRATLLAAAMKKTLLNIPNSQLWGGNEQHKLMKLLIALGEFDLAAEAFSQSKANGIRKAIKSVESSGDTLSYTTDLSFTFFETLSEAAQDFRDLFAEFCDQPVIMTLLLQWIQRQIISFVDIFAQQVDLAILEMSVLIIAQTRQLGASAAATNIQNTEIGPVPVDYSPVKDLKPKMSRLGSFIVSGGVPTLARRKSLFIDTAQLEEAENLFSVDAETREEVIISPGSLSFTACCLEGAFAAARLLDVQKLHGSSCFGWTVLPHLQRFVISYTEEFLKEITAQVQQESWTPVKSIFPRIPLPGRNFREIESRSVKSLVLYVAPSFDWLSAVLTHFCDEVWSLLKAPKTDVPQKKDAKTALLEMSMDLDDDDEFDEDGYGNKLNEKEFEIPPYTRADVCEVEPTAVSCAVKLLGRYVGELEQSDPKGLTKAQNKCFLQTLEALAESLAPSLQNVLSVCFFAESSNPRHASPQQAFKSIQTRLARLIQSKQAQEK